jgi:hypothetical protein
MPASYKIDKEHRLVLTTGWGELTFADAVAHKNKLLNDPDFEPIYAQIVDLTHVTKVGFSAQELHNFAQFDVFSPQSRRAFITPEDEKFGMARMFATLRELRGESGIGVFRNIEQAMDWVSSNAD